MLAILFQETVEALFEPKLIHFPNMTLLCDTENTPILHSGVVEQWSAPSPDSVLGIFLHP